MCKCYGDSELFFEIVYKLKEKGLNPDDFNIGNNFFLV